MIREQYEAIEKQILSTKARLSCESLGRVSPEPHCEMRTVFQRDRDRIIHCKAFRRLKHKTQVFLSPEGDHYRTRLTHTLEVSQLSRTIARALWLNEDLTEAIALGHDLGHTPFGHCGEAILNDIHEGGFSHREQGLRVVDLIETHKGGERGLNLTLEVRDGILHHSGPVEPFTLEGQIVRLCDRIAYVNHDIDDALRAKIICDADIPESVKERFGDTHSKRLNTMIKDVIHHSENSERIRMSSDAWEGLDALRTFMFERVYLNPEAKKDETKAKRIVAELYHYFVSHPDQMPEEYFELSATEGISASCKDFVAGMTDRYAMNLYTDLFLPKYWG